MCAQSGESYVKKWLSVFDKVKDDPETLEAIKDVSLTLVQSFPDLDGASFTVIIKDGKLSYQEGEIPDLQATLEDMGQQIAVLTEVSKELKVSIQEVLEQLVKTETTPNLSSLESTYT